MFKKFVKAVFGTKQDRDMKRLQPIVDEVNTIFATLEELSEDELKNKTNEFRKLLGVTVRHSKVGEFVVPHQQPEEFLRTHPDVEEVAFVGSRRDAHPGDLIAWIKPKESATPSDDLVGQIRGGMIRLGQEIASRMQVQNPGKLAEAFGEACKPKYIFFVDEIPYKEGEPKTASHIDFNKLVTAAEQTEIEDWREVSWKDIEASLNFPDSSITVDDLMPEAFAVMKETCRRHIGKSWTAAGAEINWNAVPYDVQIVGAAALAQGNIAEMATGEGKTLTAIMPIYLHAITGRGAHLVTVNDYLARRDAEWNQPLFEYLGLTVGCLDKTDPHTPQRRMQYQADVSYGTVNEFGFDYLRDNMVRHKSQMVQKDPYFCIIDEVDSVLIDEARTPLIISGPVDRSTAEYDRVLPLIKGLVQKQTMLVNQYAAEAEKLIEEAADDSDKLYDAGYRLLQCFKGSPKHKRYMKLRQEPSNQRLQDKVELDLMAQKKMGGSALKLKELEEELYFIVDERNRQIELTEKGRLELSPDNPDYFILSDIVDQFAQIEQNEALSGEEKDNAKKDVRIAHEKKAEEIHTLSQLLHAFVLKLRDVDYVVEENKVVIVDENTGRKMPGRRWSDGLHQAVEAKEGVKIEAETQTLAQITIQNYFRMYDRLSGMTGTAETEAAEFDKTYGMDVIVVPTNRPIQRQDLDDLVYLTKREKYNAVTEEVIRMNKLGLPVLVGTTNVLDSEKLSRIFRNKGLKHEVLNAKNHLSEAAIVAEAGKPGAVTIATNMAGRGTDIKLGEGVAEPKKDEELGIEWPGGLQIIGTERHESRRIDRQLRGRSGRQGDPGSSRFFVSLEDNLMRWFGSERISAWLEKLGMEEGEAIENPLVTRSIGKAQKKVELINQERRQKTLKYDDVMNGQRSQVYGLRRDLLLDEDVRPVLLGVFEDAIDAEFRLYYGEKKNMGDADVVGWLEWIETTIITESLDELKEKSWPEYEELHEAAMQYVAKAYDTKMEDLEKIADPFCRMIGLQTIDGNWQDHLLAIDDLREGVTLRSYAQKDPLVEFTADATRMFDEFMLEVNKNIFTTFFRAQPVSEEEARRRERVRQAIAQKAQAMSASDAMTQAEQAKAQQAEAQKKAKPKTGLDPYKRELPKVGRNEPCPCGSGKKYKECHGDPSMKEPVKHTVAEGAREEE